MDDASVVAMLADLETQGDLSTSDVAAINALADYQISRVQELGVSEKVLKAYIRSLA